MNGRYKGTGNFRDNEEMIKRQNALGRTMVLKLRNPHNELRGRFED